VPVPCFLLFLCFRKATQKIFSELDETKASRPEIYRSFQRTEEELEWGHEGPSHQVSHPKISQLWNVKINIKYQFCLPWSKFHTKLKLFECYLKVLYKKYHRETKYLLFVFEMIYINLYCSFNPLEVKYLNLGKI
jgi:hypothetical protein